MKRVTLDRDLEAKVGSLHEEVEVCDEAGRTVGRFLPEGIYRRYLYEWPTCNSMMKTSIARQGSPESTPRLKYSTT